ncbi:hypothetical protein AB4516_00815 [Vibrio sp. 10N.222.54.F12]|uniref:hypothetical protein n=1 Tax=Vibrio TaxID=662 RepID=UPI000C82CF42|nr:hypothetical protein [Vibrio tasmaniensis]PML17683.1 hypothetical protein BCT83_08305 [Vibrio tasmaniensis]
MSYETGRVDKELLCERINIVRELSSTHENSEPIDSILDFIQSHPSQTYYTIVDLIDASKTTDLASLMDSVIFLSSKPIWIFSLQFCYFPQGNDETIEITAESYFEAKMHGLAPVDTKGRELEDFDNKRLGFSCFIHPRLRHG